MPLDGDMFMPDWPGLRARFAASHAAMRVLNRASATAMDAAPRGSFDAVSARMLGAYPHLLSFVNLVGLDRGKLVGDINDATAGASKADG